MVRLGLGRRRRRAGGAGRFQSHFGSIGARAHNTRPRRGEPISIPLWFDWGRRERSWWRPQPGRFQSHFGSIGARCVYERAHRAGAHFNPTLVRLGREEQAGQVRVGGVFQSHFGSIGAGEGRQPQRSCLHAFQSHFGSIGAGHRVLVQQDAFSLISIPLWFDWGPR